MYLPVWKYAQSGLIVDCKCNPQPLILDQEHYAFIDKAMMENDELTAYQLLHKLKHTYLELQLSLPTVRHARRDLGWVSSVPWYCQLIREVNKEKRLKWCQDLSPNFENVIWTDECSVQLERHSHHCFRKKGQPKKLKPKPKHPLKVHLWGGISCLNPIENVWGSLKTFLHDRYKPHDLASLISGMKTFWKSLTPEICKKYVYHIHSVIIPKVIEEKGGPSGF